MFVRVAPTVAEIMSANSSTAETVVVPTGGGQCYHRLGWLCFDAACKTGFGGPVRELLLSEAEDEGFVPCKKTACFGERDRG